MLETKKDCATCSVSEFKDIINDAEKNNYMLLDVRTKGEFKSSSIEGVKNIPLDDLKKNLSEMKKYDLVYIHCHNGSRTEEACKKLSKEGVKTVAVEGGIVSWRKAGFPIKSQGGREVISLIRQVQITAGSLVIIGFALSKFVDPNFIYLSVMIGVGLLFTGISGNCMMAWVH
jgi:rhodanese-related sulfurtransferase